MIPDDTTGGGNEALLDAGLTADGRRLVTIARNGRVAIWEQAGTGTTAVLAAEQAMGEAGSAETASAGGRALTLGSNVRVSDLSPDARYALAVFSDGSAEIRDVIARRRVYQTPERGYLFGAIDPTGPRAVLTSSDGRARIVDFSDRKPGDRRAAPSVLIGHDGRVDGAVYSANGRIIATSASDGTTRF